LWYLLPPRSIFLLKRKEDYSGTTQPPGPSSDPVFPTGETFLPKRRNILLADRERETLYWIFFFVGLIIQLPCVKQIRQPSPDQTQPYRLQLMTMLAGFRRNCIEPLYMLKSGSPRLRYWKELEKTQYLPLEELQAIQWKRLRGLWEFLWENNTFYRRRFKEAGLRPDSLRHIRDLARVPILTKKEIRANTRSMLSTGYTTDRLLHFKTGGSTGKALDIYLTEECSELRNACARRHDRWSGWEPGEPIGAAWGNPELPTTLKERLFDTLLQPFIYLDTMAVTDASVREFARAWKKRRPTLLFGHAHSLFILAEHVRRLGLSEMIVPKGIISTSMMLLPHERRVIEQVFGCPVTDRYGCEEVSLIGSECEYHDGMHLNIEHLVIEFITDEGMAAKPGEPGNIVVTDLMNKAMPLVRYQVEDVGVPRAEACPCGRGLPMMEGVSGRLADFLIKPDGTKIAGISLIENTLTRIPGLDQMQIIQDELHRLTLRIVPGDGYSEQSREQLYHYFQDLFGGQMDIVIKTIDTIPAEKSGKYRFSICKVVPPAAA